MKNQILFIFVLVLLFSFYVKNASANESCSSRGYSVFTINGIFTNEDKARDSKDRLKDHLRPDYKNEPLTVDYLYNATHLLGIGDLVDVLAQMVIDQNDDYDMVEILNDASQKVTTQKLLLVGHSQGNFYANNLYDAVASKPGGVPKQSIGVYGVASPASRVAGGGKYLTSNSDTVINSLMAKLISNNILPSNINLPLQSIINGGNGHGFSDVYLKYAGDRIISDIKFSLDKLQNNDEQLPQDPCISPPELTFIHKAWGVGFASADYVFDKVIPYVQTKYLAFINDTGRILANVINSLAGRSSATVVLSSKQPDILTDTTSNDTQVADVVQVNKNTTTQQKETTTQTITTATENSPNQNVEVVTTSQPPESANLPVAVKPGPDTVGRAYYYIDTIPPVITISGTNPIDVVKNSTYTDAGATAFDDLDKTVIVSTSGNVDTSVLGTYTLIYTAGDSSGNTATATRTVNVIDNPIIPDTTAPVITMLGNSFEVVTRNSTYTDAGATALDDVDGDLTSSIVKTGTFVNTATAGTYTIIYTSTDLSGNSSSKTRTVVIDEGAMLNQPNFATISGNYAYVASSSSNALEIIDISNPSVLVHKSSAVHRVNGFELFSPKAVAVSGNYAYVVSNSNALEVIDISNPVLPVHVGTLINGTGGAQLVSPSSIAISGNYAYITVGGSALVEIVNISSPANPIHAGVYFVNLLSPPLSVYISGSNAYVTFSAPAGSGFMQILDISNPISPVLKGTINDDDGGASISNPQSVFVSGDYAYITSRGDNTLEIIDVSVPTAPIHKGKISDGAGGAVLSAPTSVFVSGSNAYVTSLVGDSLEILNVSNPTTPIHNGSLATNVGGSAIGSPQSVFVSGNYAYIASSSSNAFEVANIFDPTNPVHEGKISNGEASHTAP